ncbi:DUF4913 domain-containing protein [Amycolatopsis sp. NPDC051903]|uniref:DUF4913 domain-containing protein n=1 Tax=Amycolatopsis sp. NPDC051903 TaxID=3363936 RepID=UPI00379E6125
MAEDNARIAELERQIEALTRQVAEASATASRADSAAAMATRALDALESDMESFASLGPGDVEPDDNLDLDEGGEGDAEGERKKKPPRKPMSSTELYEWVERFVLIQQPRLAEGPMAESNGVRWCAQWWEHPAAVARLRAMGEAWREVRDALAKAGRGVIEATYWRDYFDPMWRELTSQDGPFHKCDQKRHSVGVKFLEQCPFPDYWVEPTVPLGPELAGTPEQTS